MSFLYIETIVIDLYYIIYKSAIFVKDTCFFYIIH